MIVFSMLHDRLLVLLKNDKHIQLLLLTASSPIYVEFYKGNSGNSGEFWCIGEMCFLYCTLIVLFCCRNTMWNMILPVCQMIRSK